MIGANLGPWPDPVVLRHAVLGLVIAKAGRINPEVLATKLTVGNPAPVLACIEDLRVDSMLRRGGSLLVPTAEGEGCWLDAQLVAAVTSQGDRTSVEIIAEALALLGEDLPPNLRRRLHQRCQELLKAAVGAGVLRKTGRTRGTRYHLPEGARLEVVPPPPDQAPAAQARVLPLPEFEPEQVDDWICQLEDRERVLSTQLDDTQGQLRLLRWLQGILNGA